MATTVFFLTLTIDIIVGARSSRDASRAVTISVMGERASTLLIVGTLAATYLSAVTLSASARTIQTILARPDGLVELRREYRSVCTIAAVFLTLAVLIWGYLFVNLGL